MKKIKIYGLLSIINIYLYKPKKGGIPNKLRNKIKELRLSL